MKTLHRTVKITVTSTSSSSRILQQKKRMNLYINKCRCNSRSIKVNDHYVVAMNCLCILGKFEENSIVASEMDIFRDTVRIRVGTNKANM